MPAVVYGAGKAAVPVEVDPRQVSRILNSETGHNTIFDLAVDGDRDKGHDRGLAVRTDQGHAAARRPVKRIAMDQKLRVNVPIELVGEPEGVKTQGGSLSRSLREVEFECLPADIPNAIESNVSRTGLWRGIARF